MKAFAQVRLRIDRLKPHELHRPTYALIINLKALISKESCHTSVAEVRVLHKGKLELITSPNKLNIVFVTNFGFIEAEEIISPNFQPKELTDQEDIISFLFANTLKNASDFMDDENSNINDKCFILGNAKVMTHEGKSYFLSKMILFVDSIVGLSIGD
ncbi:hypothetical protein ERICIV_00421 [Paenibacillus larvae subsp. larvae]|uniref:Uncharacterized protein n=1 Tax=Paenibacillus larvae subsp. larvae TaxID=147375 RepID=A0A2L1U972_9BACL|nr:hypothetical protein ERICIII_00421 [Paenibacillus larvae subsp. larvae]AVF29418.1 hypothetical protein ERICIV_00421 [Paenibacillus larvae subsp. larvae]MBH0343140.1 hypothetical protein [Paenibacillus larvae]